MDTLAMLSAALVLLGAGGLVVWSWLMLAQVEDDLRARSGLERLHFDL
jgi:hypothetical protein